MTYKITSAHFGFTTRLKVLLELGTLACFVLPMLIFPLIRPSWTWTPREIISGLATWLILSFLWYVQHNYSLEVDEDSVRVVGGRVIRKDHVRYLQEFNNRPWRGGSRLVLAERRTAWVRLFGGAIAIPKGLPEYDQIKQKILEWQEIPK